MLLKLQITYAGVKRRTNKATLWYVPVISDGKDGGKVCGVPPMEYPTPEAKKAAVLRYEKQKAERKQIAKESPSLCDDWTTSIEVPQRSMHVTRSTATLRSTFFLFEKLSKKLGKN